MDILFVSHNASRSGAPLLLFTFQKWLKKYTDIKFETIIRETGPLVDSFKSIPQEVVSPVLESRYKQYIKIIANRIFKYHHASYQKAWLHSYKDKRYRVIYSNTCTNGAIVENLRKPGVRIITHIHELDYWITTSGKKNWALVKEHTDTFIACSVAVANNLSCKYNIPSEKIEIIPEFIEIEDKSLKSDEKITLKNSLGIPEKAFIVALSGAETFRKGKDLLIPLANACHLIERGGNPIYFLWIGRIPEEEHLYWFTHDAKHLGIQDRIKWIGETDNPHQYFSLSDAFAMISREDPFPIVCLEAALHRKPIVCFADAGGIPELVEKDAGFILPYLDLTAMAERLLELRDNSKLASSMGAKAAEKVKTCYSVNVIAPKIHEIIQRELTLAKA
jgi:glycosyltransferase involved in cell wall biosynthesis